MNLPILCLFIADFIQLDISKQLWPEAEGSIENYVPFRQIDPEAQLRDLSVWMGHNFQWILRSRDHNCFSFLTYPIHQAKCQNRAYPETAGIHAEMDPGREPIRSQEK